MNAVAPGALTKCCSAPQTMAPSFQPTPQNVSQIQSFPTQYQQQTTTVRQPSVYLTPPDQRAGGQQGNSLCFCLSLWQQSEHLQHILEHNGFPCNSSNPLPLCHLFPTRVRISHRTWVPPMPPPPPRSALAAFLSAAADQSQSLPPTHPWAFQPAPTAALQQASEPTFTPSFSHQVPSYDRAARSRGTDGELA